MQEDLVKNTIDVLHIIATEIEPLKGMTGHNECDDCYFDCIAKAIQIVESITEKYNIVSK